MKLRAFAAALMATGALAAGIARAQAPDLNAVPDKMPFNLPYGTPITMERAQAVIQAAVAEAQKRRLAGKLRGGRSQRGSRCICADGRRPDGIDPHRPT
jgi:hypothetical protein